MVEKSLRAALERDRIRLTHSLNLRGSSHIRLARIHRVGYRRVSMIDVSQAMLDPTMVFKEPNEVVASNEITRGQKIEILRRWEYDAHQLEVAEEEAGMAVRRPEMFDLVVQALHGLDAERDTEHTPPTK